MELVGLKAVVDNYRKLFAEIGKHILKNAKWKAFFFVLVLLILTVVFLFFLPNSENEFQKKLYSGRWDETFTNKAITESISKGIKGRVIYIDAFHAEEPGDLSVFRSLNTKYFISYDSFVNNKDKLFRCGLLLMNYGIGKRELSEEEYKIIRQYIVNGGRILLLCPAWVWEAYEKKSLEYLPYYNIAKNYDLLLSVTYVIPPLKIVDPYFKVEGLEQEIGGTFSSIVHNKGAIPIVVGQEGRAAALSAKKGNSRIIVWAQNNLLNNDFSFGPKGRSLISKIFNWLFD